MRTYVSSSGIITIAVITVQDDHAMNMYGSADLALLALFRLEITVPVGWALNTYN